MTNAQSELECHDISRLVEAQVAAILEEPSFPWNSCAHL